MDKNKLNEEIVLCRSIVKKAKVCVIRKLIKKIKLLRSCKKEELREKKLRKGKRLAAEVHMMKTLRPDYVTKFALLTENYVSTGSNTKLKRKRNACAKLVKHKDLVEKVNSIRDKFSNWKEELPILLNSSKRKKSKDEEGNTEINEINNVDKPEENEGDISMDIDVKEINDELSNERLCESQKEGSESKAEVTKISKNNVKKQKVSKAKVKNESVEVGNTKKKVKKKEDVQNNTANIETVKQKIDDPFFIGKKVIVPNLLQEGNENHPENDSKEIKQRLNRDKKDEVELLHDSSDTRKKPLNKKSRESVSQDELHPSWKAKKIQMIKPFQGKKIKFE